MPIGNSCNLFKYSDSFYNDQVTNLMPDSMETAPETSSLQLLELGIQHRTAFAELLNLCFAPPSTGTGAHAANFLDDFPIWDPYYSPPKAIRLGIIFEDRLIACVAGRIAELSGHQIGMIGAVATHPDFRKSGLATLLLRNLQAALLDLGSQGNILFSSPSTFYEKLGFKPYGTQLICPLTQAPSPTESQTQEGQIQMGWCDGIFDLMVQRNSACKGAISLNPEDIRWVRRHKNVTYLYYGKPFQPLAFVALNRGLDLQGFVHDWAGDPELVRHLLAFASHQMPAPRPEWIIGTQNSLVLLGFNPSQAVASPLCLYQETANESFRLLEDSPIWIWGLDGV